MSAPELPLLEGRPPWGEVRREGALGPLQGTHRADVAVVGAGLSGLALALSLREQGLQPIVLEADRVGAGSTPASTALLLWETDRDLRLLAHDLGRGRAASVWRGCLGTLDWWEQCCRRDRIGGFARARSVYFAADAMQGGALREEGAARRAAGLPSRFVADASPWLGFTTPGALVSEGAGSADPVALLGDLLRACADAGIPVHEGSRPRQVDRRGATTCEGAVHADHVVVAAGLRALADFGLPPLARERMTYVVAVRGAPEGWRDGVVAWGAERPYPYLRRAGELVLVGGEDLPPREARATGEAPFHRLRARLAAWYPELVTAPVVARWAGRFPNSTDSLPYIGRPPELRGAHAILAFGGNGMVFGLYGAWLLARALAGEDVADQLAPFAFDRPRAAGMPPAAPGQ